MTVDYGDPNWKATIDADDEVSYCRGAAEYLVNTGSSPRDEKWQAAVRRASQEANGYPPYPDVFGWTDEFMAHHDNATNARYVAAHERLHGPDHSLDDYKDEIDRHIEMRDRSKRA